MRSFPLIPLPAVLALAALVVVACEPRRPLARAEVVGKADSLQRAIGADWGAPIAVLPPDGADADGRRWWQVTYAPGASGADRVVLVDHDTGWARLPPAGWRIRPAAGAGGAAAAPDALQPGADLLIVATARDRGAEELAREVERLNALARNTGLAPRFSLRDARGETQIVYGWSGDAGMRRDDAVRDWLRMRTPYADAYWVELAQ
ncbi:MAG TPA: hypothetical protein VEL07_07940 [Planctomycetota bacterium]|nr:hypothetical protein [Planctomycetota bacterium]